MGRAANGSLSFGYDADGKPFMNCKQGTPCSTCAGTGRVVIMPANEAVNSMETRSGGDAGE